MNSYQINVKIGDLPGNGIDAYVRIILSGYGNNSDEFLLDNLTGNVTEKGTIAQYVIKSEASIPRVRRIKIWRNSTLRSTRCYLDYIEVTNNSTGFKSLFPVECWLQAQIQYIITEPDTFLPANDPQPAERAAILGLMQQMYVLEQDPDINVARVNRIPDDEHFAMSYELDLGRRTNQLTEESNLQVRKFGLAWTSITDIKNCYTKYFGLPRGASNFNDDASFGRQRLAGANPMVIRLLQELQDIPPAFQMNAVADIEMFLEGNTLDQAIANQRMFFIDYNIFLQIQAENPVPAPIALFYFDNNNRLMPVAIQLQQQNGQDNPVFSPNAPLYTWMMAKMWFNLADAHYHQFLSHLTCTHLLMEGIAVASKRNLSHSHPIMKLLFPHFQYIMEINEVARRQLINPGGFIDETSNGGVQALHELANARLEGWNLITNGDLRADLQARGVANANILNGAYHARDDALLTYDAIEAYVRDYVNIYYHEDNDLIGDIEILAWRQNLATPVEQGGVGVLDVPNNGNFQTIEQLINTLIPIIYTCSVGHASVNFPQYDEYGYPFNYPFSLNGQPPQDLNPLNEEDVLLAIGDRQNILRVMTITSVLSERATRSLANFQKGWIVDPEATRVVERFRESLRSAGDEIDFRNSTREFPYDYLHPKHIPNAISI